MQRIYPDWIDKYMSLTINTEAPESYRQWCAISVVASCLQRKCWFYWQWEIYPNFYIILVGPPGGGKGTAMRPIRSMLQEIGVKVCAQSITREALIRRLKERTSFAGKEDNPIIHSSMTVHSEELAVFMPRGNDNFLSALTDIYDCQDPWTYDTKNMGTDEIAAVWLNLLGGTTPALIKSILPVDSGVGGGLASRMVFVSADGRSHAVPFPFVNPVDRTSEIYNNLKLDLEQILLLYGRFDFDKTFMEAWEPWYISEFETQVVDSPYYEGYNRRRATHIQKLCMVLSASRGNSMCITAEDFHRALSVLEKIEQSMPSVFIGYGRSDIAEVIPEIMNYIHMRQRVTFGALMGRFIKDLTKQELENAVMALRSSGFCTMDNVGGTMYIVYAEEKA